MNWWSSKQQLSKIWCSENKKKDLKRKKKIHVFTGKQDVNLIYPMQIKSL